MKNKTSKPRPWRVNYTVTYENRAYAVSFRTQILSVLQNVALLHGIEFALTVEYPFFDEQFFEEHKDLSGLISDLVYFRSLPQTHISAKEFRELIDHIFADYRNLPVEVGCQMQKYLKEYPFPNK